MPVTRGPNGDLAVFGEAIHEANEITRFILQPDGLNDIGSRGIMEKFKERNYGWDKGMGVSRWGRLKLAEERQLAA